MKRELDKFKGLTDIFVIVSILMISLFISSCGGKIKITFRVLDTGISTGDSETPTVTATASFEGWTHVKAVGEIAPKSYTSSVTSTGSASVTMEFAASITSTGSITSYNVYRDTTSSISFDTPYATGVATSSLSYTDTTVSFGETFYYAIAPVVDGTAIIPESTTDQELKVIIPPDNMALIHRWAANREMCLLMEKTPDRDNNYRCDHSRVGSSDGTYFDLTNHMFVDIFELGCNFSETACGGGECIGTASPDGSVTAVADSVYYDRANARCYINTDSGTSWSQASDALTAPQREAMSSNAPGLPPLVYIDQIYSQDTCQAVTVPGFGAKSILKRSEFVIAAAWDSTLSDAEINTIEDGINLPATGHCNTNSGSGITFDNLAIPADLKTLSGTLASSRESLITGSDVTENCISRYGIRDMVGNVWEWNSDQINNGIGVTAAANTCDNTNGDFNDGASLLVEFDDIFAPDSSGSFSSSFGTVRDTNKKMQLPLAIPIADEETGDGVVDYQGDTSKYHGDYFWVDPSGLRAASSGGGWYDGDSAGRFHLHLVNSPTNTYYDLSSRCRLAVP